MKAPQIVIGIAAALVLAGGGFAGGRTLRLVECHARREPAAREHERRGYPDHDLWCLHFKTPLFAATHIEVPGSDAVAPRASRGRARRRLRSRPKRRPR